MTVERISVVGDVHAHDQPLEILLDWFATQRLDQVVCVGDIVTGPGSPDRCVELLEAAGAITVRGNHDRWLVDGVSLGFADGHRAEDLAPATLAYLQCLPAQVALRTDPPVLLCHGLAEDEMNKIGADDYGYALEANPQLQQLLADPAQRIIIKGHRHRPSIWHVRQLTLIDAGGLHPASAAAGVIVDLAAMTATPIRLGERGCEPAAATAL
jgi:predicted phosphodiesterase